MKIKIYHPEKNTRDSEHRGGGRFINLLKEASAREIEFVSDLSKVTMSNALLIPFWNPFQKPFLSKKIAHKQFLTIFDVIPLKYSEHFPIGVKGTLNLWRNKRTLSYFDGIITISEASKQDIIKYLRVSEEKIHVLHLATPRIFETTLSSSKNSRRGIYAQFNIPHSEFIIYVGDVNWNKNIVNLAKAVKEANIPCVFVGKAFSEALNGNIDISHPWQKEFNEFLTLARNDSRFIFPGYITDQELVDLYQNALCNILISRDEGFGLSYLEASSQKCPSILADIPVFREIAGDSAVFADPEKPEEIARKIISLQNNQKLREDLAKLSFEKSKQFSLTLFGQTLLKILQS